MIQCKTAEGHFNVMLQCLTPVLNATLLNATVLNATVLNATVLNATLLKAVKISIVEEQYVFSSDVQRFYRSIGKQQKGALTFSGCTCCDCRSCVARVCYVVFQIKGKNYKVSPI